MPLKKLTMKPGVNRENTRYTNENGWYDCDKIRFRQGTPEKIGGWAAITPASSYLGTCRSLWAWTNIAGLKYLGTGTNLKFYITNGAVYYDITPLRTPVTAVPPVLFQAAYSTLANSITSTDTLLTVVAGVNFADSGIVLIGTEQIFYASKNVNILQGLVRGYNGTSAAGHAAADPVKSYTITVTNVTFGSSVNDFVTFTLAVTLGGAITAAILNKNYQIVTTPTANTYTITASVPAEAGDAGNGGGATVAAYEIPVGFATAVPVAGWGAGAWGLGFWGIGTTNTSSLRVWNQQNFGQDLIFGPNGGPMYYWSAAGANPLLTRGALLSALPGASEVPLFQNLLLVSDTSRFVFAFGTNEIFTATIDPMLIRWSEQEDAANWLPAPTNQSGSVRLSHGSTIVACAQTRQEILVWTDTSLYSLQYIGAPLVWSTTLLSDNITIDSDRAWATASGKTYWMGADKFYVYDGTSNTLKCDLLQYIFDGTPGFNVDQTAQVFAATVEKFNEVWWFYCSVGNSTIDRYAVYNYLEGLWYYGTLGRTAWIDAGVIGHNPIAADDLNKKLQYQEFGVDDNATGAGGVGITSYITSAEFDLDDGNNFAFVWRVLPDVTFRGSTAVSPALTMYLLPLANSGSGYNNNTSTNSDQSVASTSLAPITRTGTYPVEQFTGQINTRVRGRQMSIKVESTDLGVQWQLGSPRLDIRQDGRR